jgi:hypothetical protein
MHYSIEPIDMNVPGQSPVTLTSIFMTINYTVGMTEMTVPYNLCDDETKSWYSAPAVISEAELAQWGTDNMYIVNLVAAQAGVVLV